MKAKIAADWTPVLRGALLAALLLDPGLAFARSFGIDTASMFEGPVTCGGGISGLLCHGPASSEVFVTITGPERLTVDESAVYTIEMFETVENSGARQAGAGLNVVALVDQVLTDIEDGILSEDNTSTQLTLNPIFFSATGQITHANARGDLPVGDPSLGVFSYDFTVTAPSTASTLELRGAMNGFNNLLFSSPDGDNWNNESKFVTVVPEAGASALAAAAVVTVAAVRRRAHSE